MSRWPLVFLLFLLILAFIIPLAPDRWWDRMPWPLPDYQEPSLLERNQP